MRNPENNDKLSAYSAADRAIMQASMNAARLANKKSTAKKSVKSISKKASPKMPAKGPAARVAKPKPTDSRFTGMGAGKPKSSATGGYTPGSAKNNKATYTTGSGVRYTSAKKATPAQKTKDLKKNPLVKFVTSRVGGKSGGYGNSK